MILHITQHVVCNTETDTYCAFCRFSFSLDSDRLEIIFSTKWRISTPCERLPSPPHSRQDQCKSQPWCRQLSHPTSRACHLQKESALDHLVSCRLDEPSQLAPCCCYYYYYYLFRPTSTMHVGAETWRIWNNGTKQRHIIIIIIIL